MHFAPLVERERAWLLEEARGEPDLPDVVNKTGKMNLIGLLVRETHPDRDVSRVDRDRRRVTCGVAISGVECRDESGRE